MMFLRRASGGIEAALDWDAALRWAGSLRLVVGDPARYRERFPSADELLASGGRLSPTWAGEMVEEDFAAPGAALISASLTGCGPKTKPPWGTTVGHRFCLDMASDQLPEPAFVVTCGTSTASSVPRSAFSPTRWPRRRPLPIRIT